MVIPITTFFSQHPKDIPRRPILNTIPQTNLTGASRFGSFNQNYTSFWRRFKQSPELYAIINILTTDIIGDRPQFVSPKGEPLGRNKRMGAERFWSANREKETLRAILFDEFVTGDGYGWKGIPSGEEREVAVKEALKNYKRIFTKETYARLFIKTIQDEDLKKPKKFDYIASSTVQVNSDNFDILGYTQISNGITIFFKPEEIIHFRLNTINGNVQGYSPVESLVKELALLYFVKGNMLAFLENGGRPDILFTMKNEQPNSDSFNNFAEQLLQYKQLESTHGGLLGTGEVDVTDLSFGKQRDMEYQNLALWVTSSLLFAFGIPITRVPFLVGKSATSGDSGGMAEAGYQNMISEKQDEVEDLMNFQLHEQLGFHIKLPRSYKQDMIREAQALSMNADSVSKMQSIYRQNGMKIKNRKVNEILDIAQEDLEDASDEDLMTPEQRTGMMNQNLLDNQSTEKEPDNRKRADVKRNVANAKVNKGMSA